MACWRIRDVQLGSCRCAMTVSVAQLSDGSLNYSALAWKYKSIPSIEAHTLEQQRSVN
jgi:hypothetical protein